MVKWALCIQIRLCENILCYEMNKGQKWQIAIVETKCHFCLRSHKIKREGWERKFNLAPVAFFGSLGGGDSFWADTHMYSTRPKRISPSLAPPKNRWRLGGWKRNGGGGGGRYYRSRVRNSKILQKAKSIFLCRDHINIAHFFGEGGSEMWNFLAKKIIFNTLLSNFSSSAVLDRQITAATGTNVTVLLLLLLVNRRGFSVHTSPKERRRPLLIALQYVLHAHWVGLGGDGECVTRWECRDE